MSEKKEKTTKKKDKKEQAAAAREAKERKAGADVFTYKGEPESKIAPQAQGIVSLIKEAGKKGIARKNLVDAMKGKIETRQPESRILTYYQKLLVEVGAVEITKAE